MMTFAGDERKEDVPEDYEGDDTRVDEKKSDEEGTTYEEDILNGVGAPGEIFEVELKREHGEFADHKDISYHHYDEIYYCTGDIRLIDGA